MSRPFPDAEEGLRLHLRLCCSDPTASADVCAAYLDPLIGHLADRHRGGDEHLLRTAAEDALLGYVKEPGRFDPVRGDLGAYLRMAARGDLSNLRRGEARHGRLKIAENVVEVEAWAGNVSGGGGDPACLLEAEEDAEAARAAIARVSADFTPGERRVLELLLEERRETILFAAALGVESLCRDGQEREVKRVKDRIKKRLNRGGCP